MATQYAFGKIVTSGLVLSLNAADRNSYPGSGTTWTDMSGNGNNGTLTNGPTFSSANGGSIVFDGTDDYVSIQDSTLLDFNTAVSIDFWVYVNSYDSGGTMFIHQQNGATFGGFEIWSNTSGVIRFNKNDSTTLVTTSTSFSLNGWRNVVCTANGTTANVFLNGVNIGSASAPLPDNVNGILRIGDWVGSTSYGLNGRMSTMRIHRQALSAQEILQNYNAQKSRFGL